MRKNVRANNHSPQRNRRSIRLKGYDYSQAGAYFVSICTQNRECVFGEIVAGKMVLNDAGRMVESVWGGLPVRFDHIELDEFIVMPNHIHGIFVLRRRGESCIRPDCNNDYKSVEKQLGEHKVRPYGRPDSPGDQTLGEHEVRPYGTLPNTVGRIIQAFKSITTHEYTIGVKQYGWPPYPVKLWQRNFYEHIIRDENELNRIREYIQKNPIKWEFDRENPDVSILETSEVQQKGQS